MVEGLFLHKGKRRHWWQRKLQPPWEGLTDPPEAPYLMPCFYCYRRILDWKEHIPECEVLKRWEALDRAGLG